MRRRIGLHTLVEVRYQIEAFDATEEFAPERVFRKGRKIESSAWKKTPKRAREDISEELGVELKNGPSGFIVDYL